MRPAILAVAALVLLAAACAPARAPWSAPGVAEAEVDADWADCKRLAGQRLEPPPGEATGTGRAPFNNPLEELDRRAAAKTAQRAIESCMRAKGYYPAR